MVTEMVVGIYTDHLQDSKSFYQDLLGLVVLFETEWIVQLTSNENESLNLTLQPRDHELIPAKFQKLPQGVSVAFVVPDCDEVYEKALTLGLEIVQEPRNEMYGQRRFLTVDPSGVLVDVSSNCEPSQEFVDKYMS